MRISRDSVGLTVDGSLMRLYVAQPVTSGCWPGIVFFSDIYQLGAPMTRLADRLAGCGEITTLATHRLLPMTPIPRPHWPGLALNHVWMLDGLGLSAFASVVTWPSGLPSGPMCERAPAFIPLVCRTGRWARLLPTASRGQERSKAPCSPFSAVWIPTYRQTRGLEFFRLSRPCPISVIEHFFTKPITHFYAMTVTVGILSWLIRLGVR